MVEKSLKFLDFYLSLKLAEMSATEFSLFKSQES